MLALRRHSLFRTTTTTVWRSVDAGLRRPVRGREGRGRHRGETGTKRRGELDITQVCVCVCVILMLCLCVIKRRERTQYCPVWELRESVSMGKH